jgi:hypothetical protein
MRGFHNARASSEGVERMLRDFERAYGDYFSTWELLEGVMERLRNRMVRSMVVRNRSAEKH